MWYWTCDECNNENPCINDTCELCGKKWSASTAAEIQKKKKEHEAEIAQLKKQIAIDKANEGRAEQKRVALEKNRLHSAIFYSQMTDFIKKAFVIVVIAVMLGILCMCLNPFGVKKNLYFVFEGLFIITNVVSFVAIAILFCCSIVNNFTNKPMVMTTRMNGYLVGCRIMSVVMAFAAYFCLSGKGEPQNDLFYKILSTSSMGVGAIWIILGVVNLFITAVVSISKKKNARIELLDGTRIPAFIIGMLLILMSKLFSV